MLHPNHIPLLNKTYNFETKYEKVKTVLEAKNIIETMKYTSQQFTDAQIEKLLNKRVDKLSTDFDRSVSTQNDKLNQMLAIDYKTYLVDDVLTKVDKATMSTSLEGREPLLDYRIIEFTAQLPSHLKYNKGEKKWLLKQIAHRYLPIEVMDRPKKGFGVPLTEWFREELKEYFLIYLNKERLDREGVFNTGEVIRLRDQYLNGSKENVKRLWFILIFEMWYEKWMA